MKTLRLLRTTWLGDRCVRRASIRGDGPVPTPDALVPSPSALLRAFERGMAQGFTLIELMVVVSVLVVLGLLASSVLMDTAGWLAHYRLRSAAKALASVFQAAKMEAIKSNMPCTIVFDQSLDDGLHYDCIAFIDADGDLVYDSDGNEQYNPAGDERVLKRVDLSFYTGVDFDPSQGGGSGLTFATNAQGKPALAFNSRGLPRDSSGNLFGGTAHLLNNQGNRTRIVVNHAGSIAIEKD